jgi:uncharacterized membrane protein (UPF0127 family)
MPVKLTKKVLRKLIHEQLLNEQAFVRSHNDVELEIAGTIVSAEIADCPHSRNHGLMYRTQLDPNCGMLFAYPDSAPRSFWMENTFIPLSIAFINEAGIILNVEDMIPLDRNSVSSTGDAVYALEMVQGWFDENHVGPGCDVTGLPGRSVI